MRGYSGQPPNWLPPYWRFREAITIAAMVPWYRKFMWHYSYSPACVRKGDLISTTSMLQGYCSHCGELWEAE